MTKVQRGLAYYARALLSFPPRENNMVYIGKEVDSMSMLTIVLIALVIISVKNDIVKIILTKIKNPKD